MPKSFITSFCKSDTHVTSDFISCILDLRRSIAFPSLTYDEKVGIILLVTLSAMFTKEKNTCAQFHHFACVVAENKKMHFRPTPNTTFLFLHYEDIVNHNLHNIALS